MDWGFFVQQVVNGVTLGSMYALIALGYTMVYGILKLLNFAHGEVYMMGAFAGFGVLTALGGPDAPIVPIGVMVMFMFVAGMATSCLLAMGLERFAYRRLRDAPRIAPLITALGASFFLQSPALLLFGAQRRSYDTTEFIDVGAGIHWGPLNISPTRLLTITLTVVLMVLLTQLVARTRLGKAMREEDHEHHGQRDPRGRGRRHVRARLLLGLPPDGLHRGAEGIHRRGGRRHRQRPRRDARAPAHRPGRVVLGGLHLIDLPGPDRVLAPDRRHARAPDRAARPRRPQKGMSEPGQDQPNVGTDEWVAQYERRRQERAGMTTIRSENTIRSWKVDEM